MVYALYHGEEFLNVGTLQELADYLKVKIETIKFYSYPTYAKRAKNGYKVVKVEDE